MGIPPECTGHEDVFPVNDMLEDVMRDLGDPTYADFYKYVDDVFQCIWTAQSNQWKNPDACCENLDEAEEALQSLDDYLYERLGAGE
jgi:hypothetical protein